MRVSLLITLLFLIFIIQLSCEQKQVVVQNPISENQVEIIRIYNEAFQHSTQPSDTLQLGFQKLEELAQHESTDFQAMVEIIFGIQNSNKGQYNLGVKNFEKALILLENSGSDSLMAKALNGLGNNYKNIGNYPSAFQNLYKSLSLYETLRDTLGMAMVNNLLGDVYFQMDQIEKAKSHIQTSLQMLKDKKSNPTYLVAAHSLANLYGAGGEYDKALAIDEMGIRISDSIQSLKMKVPFLDNKATCYLFTNRMDSAYFYYQECLRLDLLIGNEKQIADSYSNLGQFFLMKGDFSEAEKKVKRSIEILKSIDAKPNLDKSYSILSAIYINRNQFEKAFMIQNDQIANNKMMIQEKEAASLAEYKVIYETQKKEAKINSLQLENRVRELTIHQQQLQIRRRNYLMLAFGLVMILLFVIAYFRKNQQKLRNQLEREKAVKETEEAERNRMAKDIHDDLGSGLSKINFLSEIILQKSEGNLEIKSHSEAIKETAKTMIDNMRDLIWALNPENATLGVLVTRMREYTTDYLEDYGIDVEYSIPDNIPQIPIANEIHRSLFLVLKETVANIAKHSKAGKVSFGIVVSDTKFILTIVDNGLGFPEVLSNGNGLKNMRNRIERIGGIITINGKINEGTEVKISIDLKTIFKI